MIVKNPSILKRPIIIDSKDKKMQVGYNDEEIRVFIPKRLREIIMYSNIGQDGFNYKQALEVYFYEIDKNKPHNYNDQK